MKQQMEGAVIQPQGETYKEYERGVRTPVAQVGFFAVGAMLLYLAIATLGAGNMPTLTILRWAAFVFLAALGLGLMLRMAGPSIKSAIQRYGEGRALAERNELEAQNAILLEQLKAAHVKGLAPSKSVAMETAARMIDAEFVRRATKHGCGWSRDPFLKRHKAVRRKDWELAKEILEGAGVRGDDGQMLIADPDRAKSVLVDYYTRSTRLLLNEDGEFTKV